MFGTYRTLLALAVMAHHLLTIPVIGHYAVHGFFILSGYLMTYIMNNTYGYSLTGIKSFAINRFLRLYPVYWGVLLLTLLVVVWFGEANTTQYREPIYIPESLLQWAQNLSLIFLDVFPNHVKPRLSPPTWALTIELLFYLLIAIGISRTRKITVIWFVISILYMFITHILALEYPYRYSIIFAGTLPFSLGAIIFHFYDVIKKYLPIKKSTFIIPGLYCLFVFNSLMVVIYIETGISDIAFNFSYYLNYMIHMAIIVMLIEGKAPLITKSFDKKVGDYSYPLYLMHWQVGFLSSMILWGMPVHGTDVRGIITFGLALIICFVICSLVINFIDKPIEKLRYNVKRANMNIKMKTATNEKSQIK